MGGARHDWIRSAKVRGGEPAPIISSHPPLQGLRHHPQVEQHELHTSHVFHHSILRARGLAGCLRGWATPCMQGACLLTHAPAEYSCPFYIIREAPLSTVILLARLFNTPYHNALLFYGGCGPAYSIHRDRLPNILALFILFGRPPYQRLS